MTLKYGNKSVPFGAIVTHGENKNGSIVAENGQVYLTGLPQSGQLQVSWGKDKNSNCIVLMRSLVMHSFHLRQELSR